MLGRKLATFRCSRMSSPYACRAAPAACARPLEEPAGRQLMPGQLQLVLHHPGCHSSFPPPSPLLAAPGCVSSVDSVLTDCVRAGVQGLGSPALNAFGTGTEEQPCMHAVTQDCTTSCSSTSRTSRWHLASLKSASSEHSAVQQMVYPTCQLAARQPGDTGEQGHAGAVCSAYYRNEEEGERCRTMLPQIHRPSSAYSTGQAKSSSQTSMWSAHYTTYTAPTASWCAYELLFFTVPAMTPARVRPIGFQAL